MSGAPSPPTTVEDILVLPYDTTWIGGPDLTRVPGHGRIYREGRGFNDSWPEREINAASARRVEGRYLYGGPFKDHFGHALTDSIVRAYAFDRSRHDGIVFVPLAGRQPALPRYFLDMLALFGIGPEDVHLVQEPTQFAALEFAEPGSLLGAGARDWYPAILERVRERLHEKRRGREITLPKKLYFGRVHILHKGTLMGESYLSAMLERAGFTYIKPEAFDLFDQLAMIEAAEEIVFTEGSSIYSVELLPKLDARVFMLPRRGALALFQPHLRHVRSLTMLGGRSNCWRLTGRSDRNAPSSPSYARRPEAIHADMVAAGLVNEPFDQAQFEARERRDATRYFKDKRGDQQVSAIRVLREELRVAAEARALRRSKRAENEAESA